MRIVLVGNYRKDKQESMERFALMMENGIRSAGHTVEVWRPTQLFGYFLSATTGGIKKWIGYVDKWIMFPLVLRIKSMFGSSDTYYHICDHSNSFYLRHLPKKYTSITCHDVLAIRGALGHADAYCPASRSGKIMQNWILSNLLTAQKIACVSHLTLKHLTDLAVERGVKPAKWIVIHNAFNNDFHPADKAESSALLRDVGLNTDEQYIFHVGSSHQRKNRRMLVDMVHALGDRYKGKIVYAGFDIEPSLYDYAEKLGLKDRLVGIRKPAHKILNALYSSCYAFVFPSFSEGFGWPVIEAQACGAPVLASSIEPMPEVSGGAAVHADPHNPEDFATQFIRLSDSTNRDDLIKHGFINVKRFSPDKIIDAYLSMYAIN